MLRGGRELPLFCFGIREDIDSHVPGFHTNETRNHAALAPNDATNRTASTTLPHLLRKYCSDFVAMVDYLSRTEGTASSPDSPENEIQAEVAEQADALRSGRSGLYARVSSNLTFGTTDQGSAMLIPV